MAITQTQAVRIVELTQRKAGELATELIAALGGDSDMVAPTQAAPSDLAVATEPTAQTGGGASETWSLDDSILRGSWREVVREVGVEYHWPDGNLDEYDPFVTYEGTGDYEGMTLALGYLENGDVVGFVVSASGSKRGITYFFEAGDFEDTREKVSMIRGGGPRGRSGFAPGEALPKGYSVLKTDVLRDRKAGKWNVQCAIAHEHDHEAMLVHTALQARLRKLA